ncbi:MAG: serine/threonine protein kinase, partial [Myxococcales bacterium]|nr:serine/threonine protein kinase [Myxococcales bacterium]
PPDPVAITRFRHEFLALRQAEIPGLVRAHALYELDGEIFYSMELLQGRNLEAVIEDRPLPAARVVEIGIELTRILQGLHERGVIHRDIKPTNIVLLDDGNLRLVDLGLGKLLPPFYATSEGRTPPEERLQTTPGIRLGTPGYIAPEAGFGDPPAARQDVFSLGVTLFRLATRKMP